DADLVTRSGNSVARDVSGKGGGVRTQAAIEHVVAAAAGEQVVAGKGGHPVRAAAADEGLGARRAVDLVDAVHGYRGQVERNALRHEHLDVAQAGSAEPLDMGQRLQPDACRGGRGHDQVVPVAAVDAVVAVFRS